MQRDARPCSMPVANTPQSPAQTTPLPAVFTPGPNGLIFKEAFDTQAAGKSIHPTPTPESDPELPVKRPSFQKRMRTMEDNVFIFSVSIQLPEPDRS